MKTTRHALAFAGLILAAGIFGAAPGSAETINLKATLLPTSEVPPNDTKGSGTLAATFDAHRTDTYLALGEPGKAEELLSGREKQTPADYNPPARLARVLLEEKKLEPAEAAVDRALALMTQGPRRIGILALKARILAAQGKPRGPVLREELAVLRHLPKGQRRPEAEKKLQAELAQLQDGPEAPAAGSAQAR